MPLSLSGVADPSSVALTRPGAAVGSRCRTSAAPPATWGEAIMSGADVDALVRFVGKVGLRAALEPYDLDPEKVGAALVKMGLFETAPLDPVEAK